MDQIIQPDSPPSQCRIVVAEYHAFVGETVRFLNEVRERQMRWWWGADGPVFDGVGWLQGLWASRSTVSGIDGSFVLFAFDAGYFLLLNAGLCLPH